MMPVLSGMLQGDGQFKTMNSNISHKIKHRKFANDEFMTPPELAKELVKLVPLAAGSVVLDPCPGVGAFYNALPPFVFRSKIIGDFFSFNHDTEWLVSNPPYSKLERWLEHSFDVAEVGVAYLLGLHNITPRRLELANACGFGLTTMHLCKVFHWFGISAFCVWQKGKKDIIKYDRIVWR